jgi:L-threonylcarbamoyladenylate synthase
MQAKRQTRVLPPDRGGIAQAARLLRAGELVAFATETVYGLGADATDPRAVAAIYAAKGRPSFNPLISHTPDLAAARREGVFSTQAEKLAEAFWPGPLTLVTPVAQGAQTCELARAGLSSIALRVPDHQVARDLLREVGRPVSAPSANVSGRVSPASAEHVLYDLDGAIAAVLDCGPTIVGVESTIIACLDGGCVMLRPGGVTRAQIEAIVGPLQAAKEGVVSAPGMLASHYAPRAQVRLDARVLEEGEIGLDFGGVLGAGAARDLSPTGDLTEAASNLYRFLRALDGAGAQTIAIAPIPAHGIGEAIRDRLQRAAAPRKT